MSPAGFDDRLDRLDPGLRRGERRDNVGSRDCVGDGISETGIRRTGFGQMIEGLALVEAGHFNRKFDRCTVSVDAQRSIVTLRDRDDAAIDLRRE